MCHYLSYDLSFDKLCYWFLKDPNCTTMYVDVTKKKNNRKTNANIVSIFDLDYKHVEKLLSKQAIRRNLVWVLTLWQAYENNP